ncbi:Nonribosomal peptide synthetase 30 [Fusarium piperis]|uniref:Nonribosomal peptide synthetase 30 n=1 Tax=Fusarium piperis TaxID=1435070 RepID=A0A9W8WJ60_9HYPO|nr:Nonribosomal peptide synthetase 30 [Fusarium piperis]
MHQFQGTDTVKAYPSGGIEKLADIRTTIQPVSSGSSDTSSSDDSQQLQQAVEFWKDILADGQYVSYPSRPTLTQQQSSSSGLASHGVGATQHLQLPLPKNSKIPTATLMRAAWALVAGRMTDSESVVFGTNVLDEPIISVVPFRTRVHGHTVSSFIESVQKQEEEVMATPHHMTLLFSGMQQASTLFQTLLLTPTSDEEYSNSPHDSGCRTPEPCGFGLVLEITHSQDKRSLKVTARYSYDALQAFEVKRVLHRFASVMTQLDTAKLNQSVDDIEFMTEQDLQDIWKWNCKAPAAIDGFIHDIVKEKALVQPSSTAVCAWDGEFTYAEIDMLSNRLAVNLITSYGVQPGTPVALCFEKSKWMAVSMLGVLKAGACFVMLDAASAPEQRLRTMVEQVQAKLVISSPLNQALSSRLCAAVVILDSQTLRGFRYNEEEIDRLLHHQLLESSSSTTLAHVIFTSGSTGTPKAIPTTHQSIRSALHHQVAPIHLNTRSRVYDFSSYSFDAAIFNIWTTFYAGGCLCVPSETDRKDDLTGSFQRLGANYVTMTPSAAQVLASAPEKVPQLETMMLVGERLSMQDVLPWWNRVRLINAYGPCECTPLGTSNLNPSSPADLLDIGVGLGQVTWIVDPDDHNRLVPPGLVGELVLEGPSVSQGYLNDPKRTASAFIEDPAWLVERGRLGRAYKTGDLVQYSNEEGRLRYIGRKDAQVKIRGQRVELGEVEHQVQQCMPDVSQVVVEMITPKGLSNSSTTMLAAFLVPSRASGKEVSEPRMAQSMPQIYTVSMEVQAALNKALPSYMVPNVFFSVRELPKAASGKLDRKKIREMGSLFSVKQLADLRTRSQGPKRQPKPYSAEYRLQGIWARVLGIERSDIGLDDSFFQLGGDSISAMKVVRNARDELDVELSVAEILQHPRLSEAAGVIARGSPLLAVNNEPPAAFSLLLGNNKREAIESALKNHGVQPRSVEDAFPCTPLQEGLVFLSLKSPGDYIMQTTLDISTSSYANVHKFRQAWEHVVAEHSALRTRFVHHDGDTGLAQVVLGPETFAWNEVVNPSLNEYLEADRRQPMSLGQAFSRFALVYDDERAPRWFVWTMHHALYDGWSIRLIMKAFQRTYRSLEAGTSLVRGATKASYPAFIKYTLSQNVSADGAMAKYWQKTLSDCEAAQFPIVPLHIQNQATDHSKIDTLFQDLPSMLRNQGWSNATPSTLIRAAWALVVGSMTNSDDVVFGVTVSGRSAPVTSIDEVSGPTMATVPFRSRLGKNMLVRDYLQSVQQQAIDMIPFEQMGLPRIAKLSTDCEHACRFQTLLVVQPEETADILSEFDDEHGGPERWFNSTYALLLEVQLGDRKDNSSGTVKARFDSRVIQASTVKSLLERLSFVIDQLGDTDDMATVLSDIQVVTPADLEQIWQWNKTVPATVDRNVHDMILERALSQPDRPAVHAWDGVFTYAEFTRLSSTLARRLIDQHRVSPGDIVGLCFEKSKWTSVAILAVLQTGAGLAMLDPFLPETRLKTIVNQVNARVVVSSQKQRDLSLQLGCDQVLNLTPDIFNKPETTLVNVKTDPSSPAYVIFTSGSTGMPKGSVISHRSLASSLVHQSEGCGFNQASRVYDFSSYGFDAPLFLATHAFFAGGCLCVPSDEDRKSRLAESLRELKATITLIPPSASQLVSPEQVPDFKTLIVGGEASTVKDLQRWSSADLSLINAYGPCECTGVSMINPTHTSKMNVRKALGIGKGLGQVTWVVDPQDHNRLASPGAVGELLLEGPYIGQGYLNNEEKTREAYVEDPSWLLQGTEGVPGRYGRLYKTGDLVQYSEDRDGSLMFVSRKAEDAQVKIRGQRAELGEIELRVQQALKHDKTVQQVVVDIIVPHGEGSRPMLVAFLKTTDAKDTSTEGTTLDLYHISSTFEDELAQSLPSYMIPEALFKLAQMPQTATGKLHRMRLRAMGASYTLRQLADLRTEATQCPKPQPTSELEIEMQQIWARVLSFEPQRIGLDDSFFRLGGDSIAAMKAVGEATKASIRVTVADFFEHRTLRNICSNSYYCSEMAIESLSTTIDTFSLLTQDDIAREKLVQDLAAQLATKASKIQDAYPCTPLQEGLISLASKRTGDYIMQQVLKLSPDMLSKIDTFKDAWQKVIHAVPVLRTRIVQHEKLGLVQVLLNDEGENIEWIEAMGLDWYLEADRQKPMGLGQPLARYALVRDRTGRPKWFVWTVHHALYDGLSLPMILEEVDQAIQGLSVGQTRPQAQSFIKYIQQHDSKELKSYWQAALDDSEECVSYPSLPSGLEQPIMSNKLIEHQIPRAWVSSSSNETTVSTMLRAAWGLVTSQMTGSDDIVFGVTVSGRNAPVAGIESMAFPTIATVPLRLKINRKDQRVIDYLDQVQRQATEMIPYEQVGLQRITRLVSPEARQACAFQALLVVQPRAKTESTKASQLGEWTTPDQTEWFTTYPLTIEATVSHSQIDINARFDSLVVEPWIVKGLLERLEFVMQQLGQAGPDTTMSDICVMTRRDLQQIWQWNEEVPGSVDRSIHAVISEQARLRPDAAAICAWDGNLTYAELDRLSNYLASYLLALTGGKSLKDTFVPSCFDKSMWTPVAMLGVLKTGAGFVLLDSALPEQRLKQIVEKVGAGQLMLSSDSCSSLSSRISQGVVIINSDFFKSASQTIGRLPAASADSAAYVIFTSGSTGTPKGVVITHRNLASALPCHVKRLGYTPDSRVYEFASYSFGASLNNMFAALITGSCLCIPSDDERRSQLDRSLVSMKATHVLLTPSVAESLSPRSVSGLKSIIFGGEAVRGQDIGPWWEAGVKVCTAYGSSECTTISTINDAASTPDEATRIGWGVGLVPWVVDPSDHERLLPPGCIGELLLEGPAVGRGYLGDLEKTAEVFIQSPSWLIQGTSTDNGNGYSQKGRSGRLYKTGDLVRYNEDGSLSFFGRKDSQVKIRGQRVELGEVEHRVKECVTEAAQVVVEAIIPTGSDTAHQTLAAFLVMKEEDQRPESDDEPTIVPISAGIEDVLSQNLPIYMVPTIFFSMKKLPMTATGKMNRRILRQIGSSFSAKQLATARKARQQGSSSREQPSTNTQRELQRIWSRILDLPTDLIGLDDGFFSLGGDSVSAMKVVGEARKAGIELAVADIFTHRTLRLVADNSKSTKRESDANMISPFSLLDNQVSVEALRQNISTQCDIDASEIQDAYPCTPLQEGLISLASKRPGGYVMQAVLELSPEVSITRFQAAWEAAVKTVDVLRTRIVHCQGYEKLGLLQVVLNSSVNWINTTGLEAYLQADRKRVMGLNDPLARYALVHDGQTERPRWFVWTIHHALYDGWSLPLVLDTVAKAYQGKAGVNSHPLAATPGFQPFIKYLEEQQRNPTGVQKTEDYWKQYFDSCEATQFPTLPSPSYEPTSNKTTVHQIKVNSRSSSASLDLTPSTLIRAAWALVVGQMTNTSDVVFGMTVSGRNAPVQNIEAMPAPTMATIPLRIKWTSGLTVSGYLETVQREVTEMMAFEQTGLHRIAKMSSDARQACQFQTLLVIQSQSHNEEEKSTEGLVQNEFGPSPFGEWVNQDQNEWFNPYALMIEAQPGAQGGSFTLTANYDEMMIQEWIAVKLLKRLELVMQAFAAGQGEMMSKTIDELRSSIMTEDDLEQIWTWNRSAPEAVEKYVHEIVEERVREQPNASAVYAWDGELTYKELDQLAEKMASQLLSSVDMGARLSSPKVIPLCFTKSMWTSVAMYGVLKAGGAFVLLDPLVPEQRLKTIVEQVGADVVLSSESEAELAKRLCPRVVQVGPSLATRPSPTTPRLKGSQRHSSPHVPMFAVFTSGSTGVPKGVLLSHRNFASEIKHHSHLLGFHKNSRVFDFASHAFDAAVHNVFATFANGACLCVPSEKDRKNNIGGVMATMRVTVADLTPTVARLLDPATLPDIETMILAGEAVSAEDAARWWRDSIRVVNGYGPSECTVMSTINAYPTSPEDASSIGPGAGHTTWVVDPNNHNVLLAPGCIGELLLEGPLVGQGYLNDPKRTANSFIQDPTWLLKGSSTRPGRRGRLYKSGDLVKYREDGSFWFMGRKDSQVKIRGQRIELEEVERQVQASWPGHEISQIVAEVIKPQGQGSKPMLAVFIVSKDHQLSDYGPPENAVKPIPVDPEIEARLTERLPAAMIPSVFFLYMHSHLPQTATGKTHRKLLREIGSSFSFQHLSEVANQVQEDENKAKSKRPPTTPLECQMQAIWARILGINPDCVGLDDSFIRLGGDSIAAMKVVGEARKHSGLDITVADLLRRPKLCDVIATITTSNATGVERRLPRHDDEPIPHTEYAGPVDQSYAQGRLWFLDRLYPGLTWYLMPFTARLRGVLRLDALHIALQAIENRHEALRTTFMSRDNLDLQEVHPFVPQELKLVELPRGARGEESLEHALLKERTTPLYLSTETGWRVTVYRLGPEEDNHHVLSILMHHIISDGWSLNVLRRELAIFYAAAVRGLDPLSQIDPLPIQYRDYAFWQKQRFHQDEYQHQLDYWVSQLQTSRPAEFFCDKPRPATLSGGAGIHEFTIANTMYDRLQKFCTEAQVTPFVVLLAAFRATHFRLTGVDDATIGTANANRDRWELRELIGFFVNLQCLRIKMEQGASFEDVVQQVQEIAAASFDNQHVPFEKIVSQLNTPRDLSRHPLVQVIFALHSRGTSGPLKLDDGLESEMLDPIPTSRFDLEFHIFDDGDCLTANVVYSQDLFETETINSMVSVFNSLLDCALSEPKTAIASLPLLTETDRLQLESWGLTRIDKTNYPRDSSIVDLFKEQVARHPNRVAVKGGSSSQLTYSELDRKSDTLARWLLKQQPAFAPESMIGVMAYRSCEEIIALFGILKANMAHLPLNHNTPTGRVETILSAIQGPKRLLLLGKDVAPPTVNLDNIEMVRITDTLEEEAPRSWWKRSVVPALPKPKPTSLAYVLFTSGSTGKPKGVMVEHRGVSRLCRDNNIIRHLPSSGGFGHFLNISFDGSSLEVYFAILNGLTLVCVDEITILDAVALQGVFERENVRAVLFTPALLKQILRVNPTTLGTLDLLCVGGDRLDPADCVKAYKYSAQGAKVLNLYGPTENSVVSTVFCYEGQDEGFAIGTAPIGEPISNSGALVMDSQQRLVPLGVMGEIVVTGDGVARGYTDPSRNVDRFIRLDGGKGERAYRTGDYARWRPVDGKIEFMGRMDVQVKIRGHRVELGEIEHAIRGHEAVNDVVVLAHRDEKNGGEPRLVSFITLHDKMPVSEAEEEEAKDVEHKDGEEGETKQHVDEWKEFFDGDKYLAMDNVDPAKIGRDFVSWTSMYDGTDIDQVEMNEWLDDTIATIRNGNSLGHVLEVGTGSGMIFFNILEGLKSYVGLDPSSRAVEYVTKAAKSIPSPAKTNIRIHQGTAADVKKLPRPLRPDMVVINSVAQYFPSQEYLQELVKDLLDIETVETIYFGDMRSWALYQQFGVSKALHQRQGKITRDDLRRSLRDIEDGEMEFLVDPGFFTALQDQLPHLVEHVEIVPKRMKATNELSCYRYAAVIHTKKALQPRTIHAIEEDKWIGFKQRGLDSSALRQLLHDASTSLDPVIAVTSIPYNKVYLESLAVQSLSNDENDNGDDNGIKWLEPLRREAQVCPSLSPLELAQLAEAAGYRVEVSWARQFSQHGGLDAVFHRRDQHDNRRALFRFPTDHQDRLPHKPLTSKPLLQQTKQNVHQELEARLRANLPTYMIPQAITILERMPLNASGKVDRAALSLSITPKTKTRAAGAALRKPSTKMEVTMRKIWAQVLDLDPETIGLDDNFFDIGGHSILAMRAVSEARKVDIELTVADIFRSKCLEDLARRQEELGDGPETEEEDVELVDSNTKSTLLKELDSLKTAIHSTEVEDILPLTSMQEHYVTTGVTSGEYAHYFYLDLGTNPDVARLEKACHLTLERIPILRASFMRLLGQHWQVVPRNVPAHLQTVNVIHVNGDLDRAADDFCLRNWDNISAVEPPALFALLKHRTEGARLVIRLSHAQYDGVCFPPIVRAIIEGYTTGDVTPLPSFTKFLSDAARQRPQSLEYWGHLLRGSSLTRILPRLKLSNLSRALTPPRPIAAELDVPLPKRLPSSITPAIVASAAWSILLSQISGKQDVVFGHVVAGRNSSISRIDEVVGPCLNLVPVRATLNKSLTATQLLQSLQTQFFSMGSADSIGFKDIMHESTNWPAGSDFESVLHHANVDEHPEFDFDGTKTKLHFFTNPRLNVSRLALASYPIKGGECLQFRLTASTDKLSHVQAKMLLDALCKIIHGFGENADVSVLSWIGRVGLRF